MVVLRRWWTTIPLSMAALPIRVIIRRAACSPGLPGRGGGNSVETSQAVTGALYAALGIMAEGPAP